MKNGRHASLWVVCAVVFWMFAHAEASLPRDGRLKGLREYPGRHGRIKRAVPSVSPSDNEATDPSDLNGTSAFSSTEHPSRMTAKGSGPFLVVPCGMWNANTSRVQDPRQPETSAGTSKPLPEQSTVSPGSEAEIPGGSAAIQDGTDNVSAWENKGATTVGGRNDDTTISPVLPSSTSVQDVTNNTAPDSTPLPIAVDATTPDPAVKLETGATADVDSAANISRTSSTLLVTNATENSTDVKDANTESHSDSLSVTTLSDGIDTAKDTATSPEPGEGSSSGSNEPAIHTEPTPADVAGSTSGSREALEPGSASEGEGMTDGNVTPIPAEAGRISTVMDSATVPAIGNSSVSTPDSAENDTVSAETVSPGDAADGVGTRLAPLPTEAHSVSSATATGGAAKSPIQGGTDNITVPIADEINVEPANATEIPDSDKPVTRTTETPERTVTETDAVPPSSNGASITTPQIVSDPVPETTMVTECVTSAAETKNDSDVSTPDIQQQTITALPIPIAAPGADVSTKSIESGTDITGRIGTAGSTTTSSSTTSLTSEPSPGASVSHEAAVDIGTSPLSDNATVAGTAGGMVQSTASLGTSPTTSEPASASQPPLCTPSTDNSNATGVTRTATAVTRDIVVTPSEDNDSVLTTPSSSPTARGSPSTGSSSSTTAVTPEAISSSVSSTATTSLSSASSSTAAAPSHPRVVFPHLPIVPKPLSPKPLGEQRNTINLDHLPAIPRPVRPGRLH